MIDGSSEDSDEDEDEGDSDEDNDDSSDSGSRRFERKDSISDDSFQEMNKSLDSGPAMLQEVKNKGSEGGRVGGGGVWRWRGGGVARR